MMETYIEKIRQENLQIKEQVQELLGWTNHDYCHFQEAMGYEYLAHETFNDNASVKELSYMREFWNWYKNQWIKRDIQFLKDVMIIGVNINKSIYRHSTIAETYMQYHKVNAILFSPHKTTMRESYARFIGKLTKTIVNG